MHVDLLQVVCAQGDASDQGTADLHRVARSWNKGQDNPSGSFDDVLHAELGLDALSLADVQERANDFVHRDALR